MVSVTGDKQMAEMKMFKSRINGLPFIFFGESLGSILVQCKAHSHEEGELRNEPLETTVIVNYWLIIRNITPMNFY